MIAGSCLQLHMKNQVKTVLPAALPLDYLWLISLELVHCKFPTYWRWLGISRKEMESQKFEVSKYSKNSNKLKPAIYFQSTTTIAREFLFETLWKRYIKKYFSHFSNYRQEFIAFSSKKAKKTNSCFTIISTNFRMQNHSLAFARRLKLETSSQTYFMMYQCGL